jgi:3-phosphoshikimate 1-carboxyvinyltransferase
MTRSFGPGSPPLTGDVHLPGDKSLSHRAVLFSAMAEGTTELHGVLDSADVRSSIEAVRALGAHVELAKHEDGSLTGTIRGWGGRGPRTPHTPIDCGNSGTTVRLLMGVLAGWPVQATLTGDESLSRRPMRRVTDPLSQMGVEFETAESGCLPITMHRCAAPTALDYSSPIASAQVKSAVLLAGLRANGTTRVTEPALSRDHTERLLPAFGVAVDVDPDRVSASISGPVLLRSPGHIAVPRDASSAAFIVAAALLVPGSHVRIPGVSLNETRTGFLSVLERMGAHVHVVPFPEAGNERVGEIDVRFSPSMSGTTVTAEEVPSLVDEIPILALVASQIAGETRFESVGELRVKESDRFTAIVDGLTALGASARAEGETLVIQGGAALSGATLDSLGDHRLAMTWAIAGLVAGDTVGVDRFESVDVSYPRFEEDVRRLQSEGGSRPHA